MYLHMLAIFLLHIDITATGALRSYESLKKISDEVGLRNPQRMTSVTLRKYTATLSQVSFFSKRFTPTLTK